MTLRAQISAGILSVSGKTASADQFAFPISINGTEIKDNGEVRASVKVANASAPFSVIDARGVIGAGAGISGEGLKAIYGTQQDDVISLYSRTTKEAAFGGGGDDTIYNSQGAASLNGGAGNDRLVGGQDADTFQFTTKINALNNIDTVDGFEKGEDKIALSIAAFPHLRTIGALGADYFVSNSQGVAENGDQHIIYNKNSGQLYYDADGFGGIESIQFALLAPGLKLGASDFLLIL